MAGVLCVQSLQSGWKIMDPWKDLEEGVFPDIANWDSLSGEGISVRCSSADLPEDEGMSMCGSLPFSEHEPGRDASSPLGDSASEYGTGWPFDSPVSFPYVEPGHHNDSHSDFPPNRLAGEEMEENKDIEKVDNPGQEMPAGKRARRASPKKGGKGNGSTLLNRRADLGGSDGSLLPLSLSIPDEVDPFTRPWGSPEGCQGRNWGGDNLPDRRAWHSEGRGPGIRIGCHVPRVSPWFWAFFFFAGPGRHTALDMCGEAERHCPVPKQACRVCHLLVVFTHFVRVAV